MTNSFHVTFTDGSTVEFTDPLDEWWFIGGGVHLCIKEDAAKRTTIYAQHYWASIEYSNA